MSLQAIMGIVPFVGLLGMVFAVVTYVYIKHFPPGNKVMIKIAQAVHDGAMVFLKREYQIIGIFVAVMFVILSLVLSPWTALAFLGGAGASMTAGLLGMKAATRAASRTCQGAIDGGTPRALTIAFRGGSVMGIAVASLGVLGIGLVWLFTHDPAIITGFAFGASSIALFARVGGGIYTKGADVGADLVGKVEAGIPEDDPRNPGVIADNVGDNVGDTAGMGADLFESYVGSVIAAMAIGVTLANPIGWMTVPVLLIMGGLIASVIGVSSISILKKISPQSALRYSTYISAAIFIVVALVVTRTVLGRFNEFWAILSGLIAGMLIGVESEYFTSGPPIKKLAKSAEFGVATNIINGLSLGFSSVLLPIITICVAIFVAYSVSGLYGIAISAVGMLATIGVVMSTDSYGPIADNAGGVAEMSGAGASIRKITDRLDSLGNTTAAMGKGFAIGSAALTALALFSAYQKTVGLKAIDLTGATTVIGLLIGAAMPFAIAYLTMGAVGKVANQMVAEIRRQFREIKGLLQGKAEADSKRCVAIVTRGAINQMIVPGVIAVVVPLAVGFFMGPEALGGFLAGATATGVLLGIMMANAGASWDNAKKWIEEGNMGGKGSEAHKAAVVGDTVGDPLKDTTGPSMNILIKLMGMVSLLFAPLLIALK
jgi:K(+)-stimulated pyrophosphate-energized sodium pump